ncbi:MAG: DEAD/DEAH box helicase [Gammaproteobacteria bacterium]|jgi:ATP-dependent RNA helicase RhlE|nr:DEAD/DEAH box helicase [Gammaproteobacteria bacterium]
MSFQDFGLMAELLRAISDQQYTTPTPIQSQAIPTILAGNDVMAAAQTGTGKTAGFTLPLLQRLMANDSKSGHRHVRALILAPTRELAAQVEQSVVTYGRHLPLKSMTIFGGVGMQPQVQKLRRGVDILVATPGRLMDHMQRGTVKLDRVEILVLDEADRMLDMGFIHDIKRIIKHIPRVRQTLMFSATFSNEISVLAQEMLTRPQRIDVAPRNTAAETVNQTVYPVHQTDKRALLQHLVCAGKWEQVLVFARTKHGADRLAKQLDRDGLTATAIHGNKSQGARTKALREFKNNQVRILVATDIAARGLDIDHLPHVVNYDLPSVAEDYVHRIGRTGRAGRGGEAISLVSPEESKHLRDIEKLLRKPIAQMHAEGFEPSAVAHIKPAGQARAGKPGGKRPTNKGRHRSRANAGGRSGGQKPLSRRSR